MSDDGLVLTRQGVLGPIILLLIMCVVRTKKVGWRSSLDPSRRLWTYHATFSVRR